MTTETEKTEWSLPGPADIPRDKLNLQLECARCLYCRYRPVERQVNISLNRAKSYSTIPHAYQLAINFRRIFRNVLSTFAQNGRIAPVVPIPAGQ